MILLFKLFNYCEYWLDTKYATENVLTWMHIDINYIHDNAF